MTLVELLQLRIDARKHATSIQLRSLKNERSFTLSRAENIYAAQQADPNKNMGAIEMDLTLNPEYQEALGEIYTDQDDLVGAQAEIAYLDDAIEIARVQMELDKLDG